VKEGKEEGGVCACHGEGGGEGGRTRRNLRTSEPTLSGLRPHTLVA